MPIIYKIINLQKLNPQTYYFENRGGNFEKKILKILPVPVHHASPLSVSLLTRSPAPTLGLGLGPSAWMMPRAMVAKVFMLERHVGFSKPG